VLGNGDALRAQAVAAMLNRESQPRIWERPLVEIGYREELEHRLKNKPREVAIAFAARAALRVLPTIGTALRGPAVEKSLRDIALAVFRATAISWAAAKYPAHEMEFRSAARAARADAAAVYAAAADALWSAFSADATSVEKSETASSIGGQPLWPQDQPFQDLWRRLKRALLAIGEDWQVWTEWYDDRLEGLVRSDEHELVYVRIANDLWDQGPAVVNAEIRRRTEELEPPLEDVAATEGATEELTPHAAIENVPSAVSFGWTSKGTISVVSGSLNWPVFPFKRGEQDHRDRLDACRALASEITRSLQRGRWNARSDYGEALGQYVAYLPRQPEEGNFLLADAEARVIRTMFAAEADSLPMGMAAKLQILLEQHIGLRAYYPQTEAFYQSVRTGHLERPLPIDAIEGFINIVRDHTPSRFEPNVAGTLENTAQPVPAIASTRIEAPKSGASQPAPPPDPIGEVDPEKTREFTAASGVNALWKAMTSGKKADENIEGWKKVIETLGPYALPILGWLRHFVGL
jgi:hypothetical protein